ncbi:hypothetical protein F0U60_38600 [Archangium minus]|uniref:Extradiol ring-cleavage dioxygenase LigAB LigA subunit domain-containing protein n=1 Tax=Archangium minus TaxID=83450 RepID=A0ABY9X1U1_9BACT|nr:hypothetical protein F0U61_38260 [Archangium violaceum]WNG49376.1 hypothetical protein F0U60_38600 [Archangium minus]
MMLLQFIADLLRDPELQRKFTNNHDATMEQAGLTAEQRAAMVSGDRGKVLELIGNELQNTELFAAVWLKGGVTVTAVNPQVGAPGANVTLKITGDYFASGAFATLQIDQVNYLAMTTSVTNPEARNSVLTASLNIPAGARPGRYSVTVSNPDGWYGLMPDAFTIT